MRTEQNAAARRMSASKLVHSQTIERLPSLSEVMKAPMGRTATEKLVAEGVEQNKLESALKFVVFVQMKRPARVQDVRGFSQRSLALFPEELRRTATRIEMVLGHPLYGTAANLFLPGPDWEKTCKNVRAYAEVLDGVIRAIRQSARDNPRERDLRLFAKRRLMEVVAEAAGRPHYKMLAELLNAAYGIVGLPLYEEESALRRLWGNHVKKVAKRRYRRMAWAMSS